MHRFDSVESFLYSVQAMPRIKAAKKAMRQSAKRYKKNVSMRREVHEAEKGLIKLAASGKKDEAKKALPKVFQLIDKATKNNIFHKNKASREKSKLSKLLK